MSIYRIVGFFPRDIKLYQTALLHKSNGQLNAKGKPINNERLEFLGDAILSAVVGHIVFKHFPDMREGFLTNTRSKLVQRDTLGKLASEMGINNLLLSKDQNHTHNNYIGGNAFEALVGAIYLDRGYDACMKFINRRILSEMINIDKVAFKEVNFKSKLLEWAQKNRVRVEFRLVSQQKDEQGNPVFNYFVFLEGVEGCSGIGYSKKESQQKAAKLTLEQLRKKPQFIDAVFAAKSNRTKMEEQPATGVPITKERSIIVNPVGLEKKETARSKKNEAGRSEKKETGRSERKKKGQTIEVQDEFDLSSISAKELSREEIIEMAEAKAYS